MVPIGRCGVYPSVGVMNQMKSLHPFCFVLHPMDEVGANKIQKQQTD